MNYFFKKRIAQSAEIEDSIMTITEKEEALIETPLEPKGLRLVWYVMFLALLILIGRMVYLNVVLGAHYSQLSKENRIRQIVIKAPRGSIYDKFGHVLAKNVPSMDAVIVPADLPKNMAERHKMAETVSEILSMNSGNVEAILDSQNEKTLDPVLLRENVTQDQALVLAEQGRGLSGIYLDRTARRSYENGLIFAPVIGYDGKITRDEMAREKGYLMTDYIGKSGLEKKYESELRGLPGARMVEIDSLGNTQKDLGTRAPTAGNDLFLNIDEELQKKLYDSLTSMLDTTETKTAAAVAIDPRSGGVLALVSLPSYDNNLFARGISNDEYKEIISNKDLPLFNRVTDGEYPPGSTLKPVVAAAALSEGVITPDTKVNCPGNISVGSWNFGDWKTHGTEDIRGAIAESCDVFFYTVGGGHGNITGLGMSRMKKYENLFGFGAPTGIDLPGESDGLIPDEDWKLSYKKEKWYIGDSYHAAIGQGDVAVTPLQLANYTAAIANGGTLYMPRLVNRVKNSNGTDASLAPKIIRDHFIDPAVLNVVREGMRQTVTMGTAQTLESLPIPTAGKTGTAQFGSEDKTHAWFISFAPYDNPTIAMVVLVEGGGEGHSSAVPVTKDVYDWYFSR